MIMVWDWQWLSAYGGIAQATVHRVCVLNVSCTDIDSFTATAGCVKIAGVLLTLVAMNKKAPSMK